jgi:hypothetical protein
MFHLTAPRVKPSTMYFWANAAKMNIGMMETIEAAVMDPQSMEA